MPSGYERIRTAQKELEDALLRPARDSNAWARDVLAALKEVRQGIAEHQQMSEGPTGSMAQILERKPNLALPIQRATMEHRHLLEWSERVANEIDHHLAAGNGSPEDTRHQAGELLHAIARHLGRASDLLAEAYYESEGGGD